MEVLIGELTNSGLDSIQVDVEATPALVLDQLLGVLPGLVGELAVQLLESGAVQVVLVERERQQQEVERLIQLLVGERFQVIGDVVNRGKLGGELIDVGS